MSAIYSSLRIKLCLRTERTKLQEKKGTNRSNTIPTSWETMEVVKKKNSSNEKLT
jgi:hypothetical protein